MRLEVNKKARSIQLIDLAFSLGESLSKVSAGNSERFASSYNRLLLVDFNLFSS